MNIASLFIRRPVMTTLVMLSILLFGIMAYRLLPVSDLPNVDYPTIQVSAGMPGASAETMASSVATVLEREFSTISGIDSMSSVSAQGSTRITLQFNLNRNIDSAAQDVQSAIARTARHLPADMPSPPSYSKMNPAAAPFLFIALTSPTLPLSDLDQYGQTVIGQRISMVDGVAQVEIMGSQKYAVRIQADPEKLFAMGVGIDDVANAIDAGNVNQPTGVLYGPRRALTIQAQGQLMRASDYGPLIVAYRNGAPVRLEEVAHVFDSVENDKSAAWYYSSQGKQRSIFLAVQRQPGRNTVEVSAAVRAKLPSIIAQLPPSVSLNIMFDRSTKIKESFRDAQTTMVLTLLLVVVVIFVFLRTFSATLIPALALPMSVIGAFSVMHLMHYSLDTLSLMALTLAIGFVVDDAIVMLENVVRHMEMGKDRLTAALDGSREISFTILSMTLSLAAVFIPVLFMGGLVGRLFQEFAVTIGTAVLVSGFISLTLTPMLCSKLLKPPASMHHGRIYWFTERGFTAMLNFYDRTLSWALLHRRTVMVFSLAVLIVTIVLARNVSLGFLPTEDQDMMSVQTEAAEGTSYKAMFEYQQAMAAILQGEPEVKDFLSSAGGGGGSGNSGRMFVHLKPRRERALSAEQFAQKMRPKLASVPGVRAFPQVPPPLPIGGRMSKSQ